METQEQKQPIAGAESAPEAKQPDPVLQALHEKVAALERDNLELRNAMEDQKKDSAMKVAAAQARMKPDTHVNRGIEEMVRLKAITAVGNKSAWYRMTPNERLAAQSIAPCTDQGELDRANRIFGGGKGSSLEASQLMRQSPATYARLRAIHREFSNQ